MENFNKRKKPDFTADKCFYENFYKICSLKMKKELFLMTRSKANDKFIVEACKYPQRIGKVDFLMKIFATMRHLCIERSLTSNKWSNF